MTVTQRQRGRVAAVLLAAGAVVLMPQAASASVELTCSVLSQPPSGSSCGSNSCFSQFDGALFSEVCTCGGAQALVLVLDSCPANGDPPADPAMTKSLSSGFSGAIKFLQGKALVVCDPSNPCNCICCQVP